MNGLTFFPPRRVLFQIKKNVLRDLRSHNEIFYVFSNSITQKETNLVKHFAFVEINKGKKTFFFVVCFIPNLIKMVWRSLLKFKS